MATSSDVHGEDDDLALNDYANDDDPSQGSMHDASPSDSKLGSQSLPMQKRRRVGRACDECRRKKIKCDGKQPCTHCTVYSYGGISPPSPLLSPPSLPCLLSKPHVANHLLDCTYDQPSNRRRNPAPQYVEALEARMHKAEALLRSVLPDINLDDPQLDMHATEQRLIAAHRDKQSAGSASKPLAGSNSGSGSGSGSGATAPAETGQEGGEESLLETMVDNSGCLDRDDQGHWDYHGHTSGIIFARRLRKQLGADIPITRPRGMSQILESPKSVTGSPQDAAFTPTHDLPSRDVARRLCHNAIDDACSLMRFVHEPSFFAALDRVYDIPPEQYTNEENSFIPLLYIVMAVGCLFSDDGAGTLDFAGYEGAIGQGYVKACQKPGGKHNQTRNYRICNN